MPRGAAKQIFGAGRARFRGLESFRGTIG